MTSPVTVVPDVVELTLDRVEVLHGVRRVAEAEMFVLAAHVADLHPAESVRRPVGRRPGGRVLPGMERAVQLGGEGTPLVAEFAAVELGARMQLGSWAARRHLADALDVRHRLPLCWARVVEGRVRVSYVRAVASRTRHLSVEAAALVDAAMVELVDGSLPWGRFESRLLGKVVAADPETAAVREAARAEEQFAKRTRASEDGTAGFYIRSSIGVIARIDATVAYVAAALAVFGDPDPVEVRRVKAVLVLANPTQAVELLAAFAAHRARNLQVDAELPLDDDNHDTEGTDEDNEGSPTSAGTPGTAGTAGAGSAGGGANGDGRGDSRDRDDLLGGVEAAGPGSALDRMDAFARRVGFTPQRLPAWLAARDTCPQQPSGPGRAGEPEGPGGPEFVFDWARLLPAVTLNLHVADETVQRDGDGGGGGVVRWDGEGPVTLRHLYERLAPYHAFTIQPVIDLPGMQPVDAYELPDRLRQAVRLRTPADAAPFSSNLTPMVDADHTEEYDPALTAGPEKDWSTRLGNLAPLSRFGHRVKTHGHWTMRQPFTGIVLWRDPHGHIYLVDHTGTHKITAPGHPAGPTTAEDPDIDIFPAGTGHRGRLQHLTGSSAQVRTSPWPEVIQTTRPPGIRPGRTESSQESRTRVRSTGYPGDMAPLVAPPGWPRAVRPPGAPDWEVTAVSWLLDLCPPEFRSYPVLRRHEVVLARFAVLHVEACQAAVRRGLSEARSELRDVTDADTIERAVEAWHAESARLLAERRSVGLVEDALRGRRFVARL